MSKKAADNGAAVRKDYPVFLSTPRLTASHLILIPLFFHAFEPHRKKFWFHHPSNLCAYKSAAIILNDFIAPGSDNSIKSFCGALVFCLSPSHWWNNLLGAAANGKLGQIGGADWQQRPAC